jgi:hypothetical protein
LFHDECEWVFPGKAYRGPWYESSNRHAQDARWRLKAACRAAGIPPITFEQLRQFSKEHVETRVPISVAPPLLILGKPGQPVIVRGRRKGRLSDSQYAVVKALVDAGEAGLDGRRLVEKSGYKDARRILAKLVNSDRDWKAITALPGKRGERYRFSMEARLPAS